MFGLRRRGIYFGKTRHGLTAATLDDGVFGFLDQHHRTIDISIGSPIRLWFVGDIEPAARTPYAGANGWVYARSM